MRSPIKVIINKLDKILINIPLVRCALAIAAHSLIFTSIPICTIWAEDLIFGIIPRSVELSNPLIGCIKYISMPTILLLIFISLLHDLTNLVKVLGETYDKLSKEIWLQILIQKLKAKAKKFTKHR